MRNNQPITNEEYRIPQDVMLVSKTDLKGVITECNDAFEAASGFSRTQVIGQPHNIVRHPDVPEAVFADLWRSLEAGNTWSQVVKNRRSDGGFYWVRANVTPIFKAGKISGFMSIRISATDNEKTAAAEAYKKIHAGSAKIKDGRIYSGIDWKSVNFFSRFSPQFQLMIVTAALYLVPYMIYAFEVQHSVLEIAAVGILGLIPPFLFGKFLQNQNRQSQAELNRIASGDDLTNEWFDPRTNLGERQTATRSVYLAARAQREESAYQLDQAQQLQTAIDQVSSNIMRQQPNHHLHEP